MKLLFHRVYEMAELMALLVKVDSAFDELDWDDSAVSRCLNKFSKTSILAHYCFAQIRVCGLRTAKKDAEHFDVGGLEAALSDYEIPFILFTDFIGLKFPDEREDDYLDLNHVHDWMCAQEDEAFGLLWEKMTDEVFHLLFSNRGFLLAFNIGLAQFRQGRGDSPSPECSIQSMGKAGCILPRARQICAL